MIPAWHEGRWSRRRWALVGLGVTFLLGLVIGVLVSLSGRSGPDPARAADSAAGGAAGEEAARVSPGGDGGRPALRSAGAGLDSSRADLPPGSPRLTPTVEAARRVTPSVVSIDVIQRSRRASSGLFDLFQPPREQRGEALGSGFAIDSDGYILTNNHVVRDADSIVVADSKGHVYHGTLVGADELTDIAVVKIPADRVPAAPIGHSDDLMVGEPAIAIGNPYGFLLQNSEATVTAGVISGVGRDIRPEGRQEVLYADMVQTDASINPGNSGGPLVNANGEVIGVNSSIFSSSGGSEGLGFAIPIDRAMRIAEELQRYGRIRRPWVGADVTTMESDSLRAQPVVRSVVPGSPADRAGLRAGDEILALGSHPIRGPLDWEVALLDRGVGSKVGVRYLRQGHEHTDTLKIAELPSERAERVEVLAGLQMVTVTPEIAAEKKLGVDAGALIVDIDRRTASVTGLQEGDVILLINRTKVEDARKAAELFRYYSGRGPVVVWVYRDGGTGYTSFYIR